MGTKAVSVTVQPMNLGFPQSKIEFMFTTFMPPFFISWALIMRSLPFVIRAVITTLPMSMAKLSKNFLHKKETPTI